MGGARSALFNWLHARRVGGEMFLRIEDTDVERNRPELTDNILEMLRWLGLDWDGEPVHQSERFDLYTDAAAQLIVTERAYYCDCTAEQIQARAKERGGPPGYDGYCRERRLEAGPGRALRFRTPDEGATAFDDLVRGEVEFENANLEDFVLLRSTGTPTFLLANIVDDADQAITHVVRGEEHVSGTPKYLLIAEALGLDHQPVFAHLPILVNEARQKLSKRRDSVSVDDFRVGRVPARGDGQLPGTAGLGSAGTAWRCDRWRRSSRCSAWRMSRRRRPSSTSGSCRRSTPRRSEQLPTEEFEARARPFLTRGDAAAETLSTLAPLVQERVRLLTEVEPMIAFLLDGELDVDEASWEKAMVKGKAAPEMLTASIARLGGAHRVDRGADPRRRRGGRRRRGSGQRGGQAPAQQGAGTGACRHHRPHRGSAALRVPRGTRARSHSRASEGGADSAMTQTGLQGEAHDVAAEPTPRRRPRWWRRPIGRIVLVLLALLVLYVCVTFVQVYRASRHDGAREAQAIVVLGAAQYNGTPSPVLKGRLDHAYDLWEQGLAPVIVTTGGRQAGDRYTEATAGYNYLRDRGVPDEALLKEVEGTSTWEELAASARFLRQRDITDVLLVSDGYHALRLEAIADGARAGCGGLPVGVGPVREREGASAGARDRRRGGGPTDRVPPPGPNRRGHLRLTT